MSTIRIERQYRQSQDELREGLETLGKRFQAEFEGQYRWNGQRIEFKRSGASGFIEYDDTTVRLELKLGLLLSPLAGKVRSQLEAYVDEYVAVK